MFNAMVEVHKAIEFRKDFRSGSIFGLIKSFLSKKDASALEHLPWRSKKSPAKQIAKSSPLAQSFRQVFSQLKSGAKKND